MLFFLFSRYNVCVYICHYSLNQWWCLDCFKSTIMCAKFKTRDFFARGRFDGRERMVKGCQHRQVMTKKAPRRIKICWIIHGQTVDTRTQTGSGDGQRVFLYSLIRRPVGKGVRHVLTFDWQRDSLDGDIYQHSNSSIHARLFGWCKNVMHQTSYKIH